MESFSSFLSGVELNARRFKTNFDSIYEKYHQPFLDDDLLDLENLTILKNNGSLQRKKPVMFGASKLKCGRVKGINLDDPALEKTFTIDKNVSMAIKRDCDNYLRQTDTDEEEDAETLSSLSSDDEYSTDSHTSVCDDDSDTGATNEESTSEVTDLSNHSFSDSEHFNDENSSTEQLHVDSQSEKHKLSSHKKMDPILDESSKKSENKVCKDTNTSFQCACVMRTLPRNFKQSSPEEKGARAPEFSKLFSPVSKNLVPSKLSPEFSKSISPVGKNLVTSNLSPEFSKSLLPVGKNYVTSKHSPEFSKPFSPVSKNFVTNKICTEFSKPVSSVGKNFVTQLSTSRAKRDLQFDSPIASSTMLTASVDDFKLVTISSPLKSESLNNSENALNTSMSNNLTSPTNRSFSSTFSNLTLRSPSNPKTKTSYTNDHIEKLLCSPFHHSKKVPEQQDTFTVTSDQRRYTNIAGFKSPKEVIKRRIMPIKVDNVEKDNSIQMNLLKRNNNVNDGTYNVLPSRLDPKSLFNVSFSSADDDMSTGIKSYDFVFHDSPIKQKKVIDGKKALFSKEDNYKTSPHHVRNVNSQSVKSLNGRLHAVPLISKCTQTENNDESIDSCPHLCGLDLQERRKRDEIQESNCRRGLKRKDCSSSGYISDSLSTRKCSSDLCCTSHGKVNKQCVPKWSHQSYCLCTSTVKSSSFKPKSELNSFNQYQLNPLLNFQNFDYTSLMRDPVVVDKKKLTQKLDEAKRKSFYKENLSFEPKINAYKADNTLSCHCCQNMKKNAKNQCSNMFPNSYIDKFCPNNPLRIDSDAASDEPSLSLESFKEQLKSFRPKRNNVKQIEKQTPSSNQIAPYAAFIPDFQSSQKPLKQRKTSSTHWSLKKPLAVDRNKHMKSRWPGSRPFYPLRSSTPFGEVSIANSSFSNDTLSTILEPSFVVEKELANESVISDGSDDVSLL